MSVVITAALTGVLATREQCPAIPYTPPEIAEEAPRSADAAPAKPKGFFGRLKQAMKEKMEEMQRQADEMSKRQIRNKNAPDGNQDQNQNQNRRDDRRAERLQRRGKARRASLPPGPQ